MKKIVVKINPPMMCALLWVFAVVALIISTSIWRPAVKEDWLIHTVSGLVGGFIGLLFYFLGRVLLEHDLMDLKEGSTGILVLTFKSIVAGKTSYFAVVRNSPRGRHLVVKVPEIIHSWGFSEVLFQKWDSYYAMECSGVLSLPLQTILIVQQPVRGPDTTYLFRREGNGVTQLHLLDESQQPPTPPTQDELARQGFGPRVVLPWPKTTSLEDEGFVLKQVVSPPAETKSFEDGMERMNRAFPPPAPVAGKGLHPVQVAPLPAVPSAPTS
jgi:hypothetical protein